MLLSPVYKYLCYVLLALCVFPAAVHAQKIVACTGYGAFISIDISGGSCNWDYVNVNVRIDSASGGIFSNALYKDTLYFNTTNGNIYRYVLGSNAQAELLTRSRSFNTLTIDKKGTLYYLSDANILTTYNPHTNITQELGKVKYSPGGDLVFYNDKLILAAWEGLVEINIANPEESTLYMPTPGYGFYSLINVAVACNQNTIYGIAPTTTGDSSDLVEIDMVNKKLLGKRCTLPVSVWDAGSITEAGGYEGVSINSITRLACNGLSGYADIRIDAVTASTDSLMYILNNTDTNYNGLFYHLASGDYHLAVKTGSGCTDDTVLHINALSTIAVQMKVNNNDCTAAKGSLTIKNENPASALSYSLNNSPYTANPYFAHLDTGTHFISIRNDSYCVLDTAVRIDFVRTNLPGGYLGKDTTLCLRQTLALQAPSYAYATYQWQDGSAAPAYTVSEAGTYVLDLATPCGTGSDSIRIDYHKCNCDFYIPGAFTPNKDGLNDRFAIHSKCLFTNYYIQVFNRMGQLIYQSRNADAGWDGTLHGVPQPAGTYIWKLAYTDVSNNKAVTTAGVIVLLR